MISDCGLSRRIALPSDTAIGPPTNAVPLPGTGLPGSGRPADAPIVGEFVGPPLEFIKMMQDLFPGKDLSLYDRTLVALRRDGYKIQWGSDGRHALYHVDQDPGETNDLAATEPDRLQEMVRQVQDWLRRPARAAGSAGRKASPR